MDRLYHIDQKPANLLYIRPFWPLGLHRPILYQLCAKDVTHGPSVSHLPILSSPVYATASQFLTQPICLSALIVSGVHHLYVYGQAGYIVQTEV